MKNGIIHHYFDIIYGHFIWLFSFNIKVNENMEKNLDVKRVKTTSTP